MTLGFLYVCMANTIVYLCGNTTNVNLLFQIIYLRGVSTKLNLTRDIIIYNL